MSVTALPPNVKPDTKPKARPLYDVLPDGRWDFYLDHSTLKDFVMCEQYFDYRHNQGIVPRGKMPIVAGIGSWWSNTMEHVYNHIKEFGTIDSAATLGVAAKAWVDLGMDAYEKLQPGAWDDFGGRAGAIEMMTSYYNTYIQQDARNWKVVGAESGFGLKGECLVGENSKVVVHWVGKPDLTIIDQRRLCPLDHKSVSRIDGDVHARYKPHPQTAGYIFATEHIARNLGLDVTVDRCIINVCARAKPPEKPRNVAKPKPRYVRVVVGYSPDEIQEWRKQTLAKVTHLRNALETNTFIWNENMCSNMYHRPCPYRGVCASPPKARPIIIAGNFDFAGRWIPYIPEED
jgi:PD-(D/E)XK nuclease superfamily